MLAKRRRLTKEKDFEKTFKRGKSFYAKFLGVKILANECENNRYGIIISTKISKKATVRNRLKRQIRAAIKELDEKIASGFDIAVIALPAIILNHDYQDVKSELERILFKLKLLS